MKNMRAIANCKMKVKHVTEQKARAKMNPDQDVYLCPICRYFHITGLKTRKERGLSPYGKAAI